MQIFIKTISGNTITLGVESSDSILKLKEVIHDREGVKADLQRLVLAGKELGDHLTLLDSGVQKESVLHLSLRLVGGMDQSIKIKRDKKSNKAKEKYDRNGGFSQKHIRIVAALTERSRCGESKSQEGK